MEKKKRIVNILGERYTILYKTKVEDSDLIGLAGYVKYADRAIIVDKNLDERMTKITLRHEIIHAFLFESGLSTSTLSYNGAWATNEEAIDWLAMQWNKINEVFGQLYLI